MSSTERLIQLFGVADGELNIGGLPLSRLAARVGSTPFFAYDRGLLTKRVGDIRAALPEKVHLGYAVKANPMPAVVQHMARLVDALDVASAGEMAVALDTGMAPDDISFAGPGKTDAELTQAVAACVLVEVESSLEAERLGAIGAALGIQPRIALRVNPDFSMAGSGMRMGGGPQQFGIDAEQVPDVMGKLRDLDLRLEGFHVFAGSQNLRAEVLVETQEKTVDLVVRLAEHMTNPVRYLNLGGGFGIPYLERDQPLDLARVGDNLSKLISARINPAMPDARTQIELGRYLVGEAGIYVTRVVDKKRSRGRDFLVVDGGMHHQLAASGNFGQVIRRNFPLTVAAQQPDTDEQAVSVVGCLCTPLDLLGDNVTLPVSEVGDLLVLFQAGAYGLTASPTRFLGHPEPAEVLV